MISSRAAVIISSVYATVFANNQHKLISEKLAALWRNLHFEEWTQRKINSKKTANASRTKSQKACNAGFQPAFVSDGTGFPDLLRLLAGLFARPSSRGRMGGYNNGNIGMEKLGAFIGSAICRAQDLEIQKSVRWLVTPGPRVYQTAEQINHLKKYSD